jgi:hypothetical protein
MKKKKGKTCTALDGPAWSTRLPRSSYIARICHNTPCMLYLNWPKILFLLLFSNASASHALNEIMYNK